SFDCFELPIELASVELAWFCFDFVPIGGETNEVERIGEKGFQGRLPLQTESLDLSRPKAETKQGRATSPDRCSFPGVVDSLLRLCESRLQHQRSSNQAR